jgi:dihydroflavonol-4-reductase
MLVGTVRSLKKTEDLEHLQSLVREPTYPLELVEANLSEPNGWPAAVDGIDVILHTASPFIIGEFPDPNVLIKPAVDGTLHVLRAAAATRGITTVLALSQSH